MAQHDDGLDLLRAQMTAAVDRRNDTPLEDFSGLTPNEMTAFIYQPFDTPELIELPTVLSGPPSAPILDLLLPLFAALDAKPLTLTAKGNLPTAFCRELSATYQPPHDPYAHYIGRNARNEDSFWELHLARTVADLAGLVYKRTGKLHLTRRAAKLLGDHGPAGIYPVLFETYTRKYNWAYADRYPPLPFIQGAWAFTCYLLQHHGHSARPESFYSQRFLTAFPTLLEEAEPTAYRSPEEVAAHCYEIRALRRFLGFFGLVDHTWVREPKTLATATLTRAPLLLDVVRFQVR